MNQASPKRSGRALRDPRPGKEASPKRQRSTRASQVEEGESPIQPDLVDRRPDYVRINQPGSRKGKSIGHDRTTNDRTPKRRR